MDLSNGSALELKVETTLESIIDPSVNFIAKGDFPGSVEARYVRRSDRYVVVYLSSQTGCDKACRMCHLTQTGQTSFVQVDLAGYLQQARTVLSHYDRQRPAEQVHFNFMSRGEALANPVLLDRGDVLLSELGRLAVERDLDPRFLVSTIMPHEMRDRELHKMFPVTTPDLYYSIYSVNPEFRRRWLPRSLPVDESLGKLLRYQQSAQKLVRLHWAFIEDPKGVSNTSESEVDGIIQAVKKVGLRVSVNIVRYNPFSPKQGTEPSEEVIMARVEQLRAGLPEATVKVVQKVGFDVKASCGMFVPKG